VVQFHTFADSCDWFFFTFLGIGRYARKSALYVPLSWFMINLFFELWQKYLSLQPFHAGKLSASAFLYLHVAGTFDWFDILASGIGAGLVVLLVIAVRPTGSLPKSLPNRKLSTSMMYGLLLLVGISSITGS